MDVFHDASRTLLSPPTASTVTGVALNLPLALDLLIVGYLPGAILFRLPVLSRDRRAALEPAERAYWAIVLSCVWTLIVALALAAAEAYRFERLLLVNVAAVLALAAIGRRRLLLHGASRAWRPAIIPVALVAGAIWLYSPPAEYVIGGKDPGVYINAGIQIAQRGGLVIRDPVVAAVPDETRGLFFPSHHRDAYYGIRFMGFFLLDPESGAIVDQFPHLYPVAIAVAYGLSGLTGARYAAAACAVAGVLGLYFLGTRVAGRMAGTIAAALLAMNVVQVWYARYPNAEMIGQALLLAGLLALARGAVDDDPFFLPVGGVLLGLVPFARIDGLPAIALAALAVLLLWLRGRAFPWSFAMALAAAGGLLILYLSTFLDPYLRLPLLWLRVNWVPVTIAAGVAAAAILVLSRMNRRRVDDDGPVWSRVIPVGLAAVVICLAVYAFFFREPGGRLAPHDAGSLRMYGWYVHPAALAAALAGLVLLALRRFWHDPAFLLVSSGMALFVFYRLRIVPEHFWATRRFLLIILPATMLYLAAAVATFGREAPAAKRGVWAARWALRLILVALVAASFWQATRRIVNHVEYAGVIPRLEALAGRFGSRDLLIFESRNASDLHVLALPLAYTYGKPVLVLDSPKPDKLMFEAFLRSAQERYEQVYFLGGGGTDLLSRNVNVEPVDSMRFQVPEYESPRNAYPTEVRHKEFDFGIYRFVPAAAPQVGFDLDLGRMDDLYVVRFHAKEEDARGTYRWTSRQCYLSLPGITPDARYLTLWMEDGGRPGKAGPARVEVYIGETLLGTAEVTRDLTPFTFEIPLPLAEQAARSMESTTIRLLSTIWKPSELLGVGDARELGVRVDRVQVRTTPAASGAS